MSQIDKVQEFRKKKQLLSQKKEFGAFSRQGNTLKPPTKGLDSKASTISAMNSSLNQKMSELLRKKHNKPTEGGMNNTIGGGFQKGAQFGSTKVAGNMNSSIGHSTATPLTSNKTSDL